MKHPFRTTVLILLVALLVCTCASGTAQAADNKYSYTPAHKGYTLTALIDNGTAQNPVGVRFSGYYFGNSDIAVMFDIYSSPSFAVDFFINDDEANLTDRQSAQRTLILNTAEELHNLIVEIDKCANTQYNGTGRLPTSDVFRYNSAHCGETLEIASHTYNMLVIAKTMYRATDGAFNPAVYRLVDLWGFSSRIYSNGNFGLPYDREVTSQEFWTNGYPLPDDKYVSAFSAADFLDFSDQAVTLSQQDGKYFVTKNVRPAVVGADSFEQWLDLGGVAKGYVVDLIQQKLEELGADRYNVDAGSSSMAFGKDYTGGTTSMSLPDPFLPSASLYPSPVMKFALPECTLSTSGQYVRKYVTNGVEYSHIIDGSTGAPAQTGVRLVSVIAPKGSFWAGKTDCLTTALTVMGRDKIVDFINGYLAEQNLQVVVMYQDLAGKKNVITNIPKEQIEKAGDTYDDFAWKLKWEDGKYVYDAESVAPTENRQVFKTVAIVLGSVFGAGLVALAVYHFLRRKNSLENVKNARRDKPFKPADVGVYLAVVLVIVVLFAVFFGGGQQSAQFVKVVDMSTGETLFVYSVSRNDWQIYENSNGWTVQVDNSDGLSVTFTRQIDGKEHFNKLQLKDSSGFAVKMTDSLCGFHQDCVHNFGKTNVAGSAIVCSPNRLKVILE